MAMRVRVLRDFAAKSGMVVRAGGVLEFEDEADAYEVVHAGHVEPPLRLRAAIDCLVGSWNVEAGDLVDIPPEMGTDVDGDRRFEPLAAVVLGEATDRGFDGVLNFSAAPGELAVVPPRLALQLIAAGGRYATKEDAAGLDLGGRDRFAKPEPTGPTGSTSKLYFPAGGTLPDGRTIPNDSIVDVAEGDADALVAGRRGVRCVKARVLRDGVIVANRVCSKGDVVEVPPSIADDGDRFEAIEAAERAAGKAVDVLAMVGGKAAEEKTTKAAARKPAAPAPDDAR
ncbi:MAG: hypothetical protein BGO49_21475 [Planctomycetales bacterium 71-10]|nr:MAG: hypothetical protein BGO49_21475 [Planctomycetales bacterium 71-10]